MLILQSKVSQGRCNGPHAIKPMCLPHLFFTRSIVSASAILGVKVSTASSIMTWILFNASSMFCLHTLFMSESFKGLWALVAHLG